MDLTVSDVQKLIQEGENQHTEFKGTVDMRRISILVSAFANTDGGLIIYGYAENKNAFVGISNKAIEQIEHFIKEDPMGTLCKGIPFEIEGKMIYVIRVKKSKELIFAKGVPYIRCGERITMPESKDIVEKIHEHVNSEKTEKDYLKELAEGQKQLFEQNEKLFEQNEKLKELLEAEKKARDEDKRKAKIEKSKSSIVSFVMGILTGILTGVIANYVFSYLTTGLFPTVSVPVDTAQPN